MHPRQIDRFFRRLAAEWPGRATIILTGAAAGSLWGHVRASRDIDFAIRPARRRPNPWPGLDAAIQRASRQAGIQVNYAEDIGRWSAVSFLDYARHTRRYRRFGAVEVRLLEPAYWSIGKVTRFLRADVEDLVAVLNREEVPAGQLIRLWARALRASPASAALGEARRQMEYFLRAYGRRVWGKSFDADRALEQFRKALAAGWRMGEKVSRPDDTR